MIILDPTDGIKAGFLHKPISDTKKTPSGKPAFVVLFPLKGPPPRRDKWREPVWFKSVHIYKDGAKIMTLKRHSKHFQEGSAKEKHRQVWVGRTQAKALPKNIVIVATDKRGIQYGWPIKDPTQRVD